MTLLHLGPGLANGAANLHNARRAHTPVVNLIGDHATWHLAVDSPLKSDIEGVAAPVSDWVRTLTGGAIGQGLPCATGAAIACPDRTVVAFQADGSGLYTLQALWTQARESLDVTTIICANRTYRILQIELHRAGLPDTGRAARGLTDLGRPTVDWVHLAAGMGVPGVRAEDADTLVRALQRAYAEPGPHLIEAVLA
jgi:thiamine pyrophosphate-dependent acetolactate synthase large subunit-like protein